MRQKLKLIIKLLLIVTAINIVVASVVGTISYFIWPDDFFNWFPAIPVFFWFTGVCMTLSMEFTPVEKPNALTFTYMVARGLKILLATAFIGIYAWVVHTNVKQFGFTTLGFYIIFLVIDTLIFYKYEKRRKKKRIEIENDVIEINS